MKIGYFFHHWFANRGYSSHNRLNWIKKYIIGTLHLIDKKYIFLNTESMQLIIFLLLNLFRLVITKGLKTYWFQLFILNEFVKIHAVTQLNVEKVKGCEYFLYIIFTLKRFISPYVPLDREKWFGVSSVLISIIVLDVWMWSSYQYLHLTGKHRLCLSNTEQEYNYKKAFKQRNGNFLSGYFNPVYSCLCFLFPVLLSILPVIPCLVFLQ